MKASEAQARVHRILPGSLAHTPSVQEAAPVGGRVVG
jgi:hypothetical protein